jgi:hypothetical protein
MKRVFSLPVEESAELTLLQNMLEAAGIRCVIRNEQLSLVIPAAPFAAELWVENDQDFSRALELYETWRDPAPGAAGSWLCRHCGERLRVQFDSCWKCGHQRDPGPDLKQARTGN